LSIQKFWFFIAHNVPVVTDVASPL